MVSRTKFTLDDNTVKKLFEKAEIADVTEISPLGEGEYNAVYLVKTKTGEYVLKIAPKDNAPVMTYEKNMMRSEVYWYDKMSENSGIRVPKVYFKDYSRQIIPADYFIMEKINGEQLDKIQLSKKEKVQTASVTAAMAAQLHNIKGEKFGYIQNNLYDNWYEAVRSFVENDIADCEKKDKKTKRGEKLLKIINENRRVLEKAECCMVNFDIWPPNIMCERVDGKIKYSWIDPERSFWGDRICDFMCLELFKPLDKKTKSLEAYNGVSDFKVLCTEDEKIRYAIALGYAGLIIETEKYYRYTPHHFGWWRNVIASKILFSQCFGYLKK